MGAYFNDPNYIVSALVSAELNQVAHKLLRTEPSVVDDGRRPHFLAREHFMTPNKSEVSHSGMRQQSFLSADQHHPEDLGTDRVNKFIQFKKGDIQTRMGQKPAPPKQSTPGSS